MTANRSGCTAEAYGGAHARVPQRDPRRAALPACVRRAGHDTWQRSTTDDWQPGISSPTRAPRRPGGHGRPGGQAPAERPHERDDQVNIHFSGHWPTNAPAATLLSDPTRKATP